MAVAGVVAVVAIAAIGLFLWLRAYSPLQALGAGTYRPGPSLGADVEPTFGSGGKTVFIPVYRKGRLFKTTLTLHNGGRFAVTITGLGGPQAGAVTADSVTRLRLEPHQSALVVVLWRLRCRTAATTQASSDTLRLRYRYLSLFRRTQSVELPFAVTLRCSGGPPASP